MFDFVEKMYNFVRKIYITGLDVVNLKGGL